MIQLFLNIGIAASNLVVRLNHKSVSTGFLARLDLPWRRASLNRETRVFEYLILEDARLCIFMLTISHKLPKFAPINTRSRSLRSVGIALVSNFWFSVSKCRRCLMQGDKWMGPRVRNSGMGQPGWTSSQYLLGGQAL